MTPVQDPRESGRRLVVRDSRYAGKFHIPTDDSCMAVLCGREPRTPAGFLNRGSREAFEDVCPERICKRCRRAEVVS